MNPTAEIDALDHAAGDQQSGKTPGDGDQERLRQHQDEHARDR